MSLDKTRHVGRHQLDEMGEVLHTLPVDTQQPAADKVAEALIHIVGEARGAEERLRAVTTLPILLLLVIFVVVTLLARLCQIALLASYQLGERAYELVHPAGVQALLEERQAGDDEDEAANQRKLGEVVLVELSRAQLACRRELDGERDRSWLGERGRKLGQIDNALLLLCDGRVRALCGIRGAP